MTRILPFWSVTDVGTGRERLLHAPNAPDARAKYRVAAPGGAGERARMMGPGVLKVRRIGHWDRELGRLTWNEPVVVEGSVIPGDAPKKGAKAS